jgi:hypothetical protein
MNVERDAASVSENALAARVVILERLLGSTLVHLINRGLLDRSDVHAAAIEQEVDVVLAASLASASDPLVRRVRVEFDAFLTSIVRKAEADPESRPAIRAELEALLSAIAPRPEGAQ